MNKFKISTLWCVVSILTFSTSMLNAISFAPVIVAINRTQSQMVSKWSQQINMLKEQITMLKEQGRSLKNIDTLNKKANDYLEDQIERQCEQIHQMDDFLKVFGNPSTVSLNNVSWRTLEARKVIELAERVGIIDLQPLNRIWEQVSSIYEAIPIKTSYGTDVDYTPEVYTRYTAIDREVELLNEVELKHREIRNTLYRELETCLEDLQQASTDAEVQKLHARISALNGQITLLEAYRCEANEKLVAQHIQNQNQSEKECSTNIERSFQESKDEAIRFKALTQSIRMRRPQN